ncbi:MAG: hypothetical protein H7Z37_07450 [Pyrinomonadaceae bacterium]|nr:hypothetical protein [Pyrinomonadaceae bacterium]
MEKSKTIKSPQKSAKGFSNKITREHDARSLSLCVVSLIIGLIAVGSLVFAAQQHFTAIQRSSQNVELRRQRDSLLVEQRKLISQRETALSPKQLMKNALQLGLKPMTVNQIESFDNFSQSNDSNLSSYEPGENNVESYQPKSPNKNERLRK